MERVKALVTGAKDYLVTQRDIRWSISGGKHCGQEVEHKTIEDASVVRPWFRAVNRVVRRIQLAFL
jgi:hypothetical protein